MAAKLPDKKTLAQKSANAKVMAERYAKGRKNPDRSPPSKSPSNIDFRSYYQILGAVKWIATEVIKGRITLEKSAELRQLLSSAGEHRKKLLQSEGKWIEKSERKHEVDVSDKLAACLLKVQGSTTEQLKKMKSEVDKVIGGLRECTK